MASLRSLTKRWLPRGLKKHFQQLVLGYHSYAPSFSAAGEDTILRHIIGSDTMDGFYVDVGAYDPVRWSNTFFFYLSGWRGINIEARPGSRQLFDRVRPRDINVEVGVSTEPGQMTYYVIGEDSPMNSFSREFLEHTGMFGEIKREILVPVVPLADVLERHLPVGQRIDFFNVDVEGSDLQALRSNDWDRYRPRFVVVEDTEIDVEKSAIVRFMKGHGYDMCIQNVISLDKLHEYFFVDRMAVETEIH
jgi:FkbM family methyltransferase